MKRTLRILRLSLLILLVWSLGSLIGGIILSAKHPLEINVTGQVAVPGSYTLPPGSRITDAVKAAGGLTPYANFFQVDMSQKLHEGDTVHIP